MEYIGHYNKHCKEGHLSDSFVVECGLNNIPFVNLGQFREFVFYFGEGKTDLQFA
jgi:hypothetical protein